MKTIVTHLGPDLDAITSVWLAKTFLPGWEEATMAFVPAGTTLGGKPPESDPDVMHVDTGFGKFDHHQTDADTCAAVLVYEEVVRITGHDDPALERLCKVVNDLDHFREVFFPNPDADYWEFSLETMIDGWRLLLPDDPLTIMARAMDGLDAVYKTLQNKVWAEKDLTENGREFATPWGKAIALETVNDEVVHLGQKKGYVVVVRLDPKKKYLRIKALPRPDIDLTHIYEKLKLADTEATWFLHASRHMVLNGSTKNPSMRPTSLPIETIIHIIEQG